MRLVSALLFVALTGSVTLADEAKPADPKLEVATAPRSKVPLRVVRMLPETRQVLLLDRNRGTHVVAEVGQDLDGYIIDDIAEDEVTLVAPSGAEVILAAPDMSWRRRVAERKATAAAPATIVAPAPVEAAPQDPYADLAAEPVRVVSADGIESPDTAPAPVTAPIPAPAVTVAPTPATPPAAAPATPPAAAPATPSPDDSLGGALAGAVTGSPAPTTAPAPAAATGLTTTLARADVDAALGDFGATAVTFDARFVAEGLRIDHVVDGTILAKAGLRAGDTITAIDGKPLRSYDDAADLYARMQTARTANVALTRAGKPMTLKVTIR